MDQCELARRIIQEDEVAHTVEEQQRAIGAFVWIVKAVVLAALPQQKDYVTFVSTL